MKNINQKIKKTIIGAIVLFLCSLIIPVSLFAQQMDYGVKGGINVSNLFIDEADDESARTGFHGGFYAKIPAGANFAIQPELLFNTKGTNAEYDNGNADFRLNYIDIPVLADFRLGNSADIYVGPYLGILLNNRVDTDGALSADLQEFDRSDFAPLDFGLSAGFGLNFEIFSIGTRYNLGLVQVAKSEDAEVLMGNARNSLAQVYLAFPLR
ncbi:MAG: porin family protein [Cyclobacteriaceae bacterium]